MKRKEAMISLGTTNIFKTLFIFIKWAMNPQSGVDLAKKIYAEKDIETASIAIGYINEFYSKYLAYGKSNDEIIEINQQIDQHKKTKNKIAEALQKLRDIRQKINKKINDKDQIITTTKSFGVSKGQAIGHILNINSDKQKIPKNTIGIFPTSGPKYTTQYPKCVGIIFLNGAITSHGAILSREFKIPAIVNPSVKLNNETNVTIDGSTGSVKVVDNSI